MDLIIVRGTLSTAYYFFLQTFAEAKGIQVLLDRRLSERRKHQRQGSGEGETDRRRPSPTTWERGDFVVVPASRDAQVGGQALSSGNAMNGEEAGAGSISASDGRCESQARVGVVLPFKRPAAVNKAGKLRNG